MENQVMKNEIKKGIKVKTKYQQECLHCSHQQKTKINKIKFLNGKLVIDNEVIENEIKIKIEIKTNYCVNIAVADKTQK